MRNAIAIFNRALNHITRSMVSYQCSASEVPFRRSFCNYRHFWFRNGTVSPYVGSDFLFLRFLEFHVRSSYLSSEEIFGEEIGVSRSSNLIPVLFGSTELQSDIKQTVTSILSHVETRPAGISDRDSIIERPSQPGINLDAFRFRFRFANPRSVWYYVTLSRAMSHVWSRQAHRSSFIKFEEELSPNASKVKMSHPKRCVGYNTILDN